MKTIVKSVVSLTVDDIRKLRDDFGRRYTNDNGLIDWAGATAEIEKGASIIRAEIARIRAESSSCKKVDTSHFSS